MKVYFALAIAALWLVSGLSMSAQDAKQAKATPVVEVTLDQAEKLTQCNTNLVILDVRTRKEFAAGHLAGAKNLDFYAPDFEEQLKKMDKNKPYLVHCAIGGRSAEAREKMKELGFQQIFHMDGGYKAWTKAGKKTEQ